MLLSTMLVTFYRLLAESGATIDSAQTGITAVSLGTSYIQLAQGLAFDEVTIDAFITQGQLGMLTPPTSLGRDVQMGPDSPPDASAPPEDGPNHFDDIDDFNNFPVRDTSLEAMLGDFNVFFLVYYVDPANILLPAASQTAVKRMDLKIWRVNPPSTDTLKMTYIIGYFKFTG